ncbi:MAG: methyltransferase domain-containing protein [Psychroserpens sp.]|uniref:class I SAM-dependent methyltransferase n=1 Tax=Psychroserpens sp. TaxID=2020870 RepID=UPI0030037105
MKYIKALIPSSLKRAYANYKKRQYVNSIIGKDVHCPICKSEFKFFADYGIQIRANALCHNCNSVERHRLLYLFIESKFNFFKADTERHILHFAPERFFYNIFKDIDNVKYSPCDLHPELYNFDKNVLVEKADLTKIPFEDCTFDFIICNHVLEHVPDDKLAMNELFRVMKKGGAGIFQVPIDYSRERTYEDSTITAPEERLEAFGQHDHVRWYGQDYKSRLEQAGFNVIENDFVNSFTPSDQYKYGLMNSELIYYCEKTDK